MLKLLGFVFFSQFNGFFCSYNPNLVELALQQNVISLKNYIFWPNATIPFYVTPEHFDHEQSLSILTALSMFSFKTCLKFLPVMAAPASNEHVMVFENSGGVRRCVVDSLGHSVFEPHIITLGYDCLQSPQIDMMIMKALGFPFEHNRINRGVYIEVLAENIEPGYTELFTKDATMPVELRAIPYDANSVTHFDIRAFSKNGHRTILFKDPNVQQNRVGLTKMDLRRIETVYGPECRIRDRQEKLELCQSYPGVARKKRDVNIDDHSTSSRLRRKREIALSSRRPEFDRRKRDVEVTQSLRVNPNITPPPNVTVTATLKELGIEDAVQVIVDQVNKLSALALKNAREKYCNNTKPHLRSVDIKEKTESDILGVIEVIANYAQGMVRNAVANLTKFCEDSETIEIYQRAWCMDGSNRCRPSYRSTKSGAVKYSTQHRPFYIQSTKHRGSGGNKIYAPMYRAFNDSDIEVTEASRRKREAEAVKEDEFDVAGKEDKNEDKHDKNENEQDKKENEQDKKENEQDKKENEKDKKENEQNKEALRAGTRIPETKNRNLYEPIRRSQRKNRIHHARENLQDSSLSIEERPKKRRVTTQLVDRFVTEQKRDRKRDRNREEGEEEGPVPIEMIEDVTEEIRHKNKRARKPMTGITPRVVKLSKANEEFYKDRRWSSGVVRYVIKEDTTYDTNDLRRRLAEVNNILRRKTCVRLKEITEDQAKKYNDYLVLDNSPDYVTGRVGGRQSFGSIELFRGDQHRQHAAMMAMAMLGFYFEVSRHDRDKHVRVHMRHVRPDKLHHFEKIREDATLPLPYDYSSATHPAWQYWRKIGRTGISTVATYKQQDPDGSVMKLMGQNSKLLSDIDIVKINSVYGIKCFQNAGAKVNEAKTQSR